MSALAIDLIGSTVPKTKIHQSLVLARDGIVSGADKPHVQDAVPDPDEVRF